RSPRCPSRRPFDARIGACPRLSRTRSVPMARPTRMPSLPRIRRTRSRDLAVIDARPREPAELSAAGLTWIHFGAPALEAAQTLAERFGWHPLDVEDVLSRRQRPKVDDYADEGYLFAVLHFPAYDPSIQRLNAVELDVFVGPDYLVTLPGADLKPLSR